MHKLAIPKAVEKVFRLLEENGYQAYLVGGCVRDYLRGVLPGDFDMTTDATPDEMKICFEGLRVIETGISHGTLTVLTDGIPVEITTHRTEETYTDFRHPDEISFSKEITDDLARRDFTMNALAYHPGKGIVDCFGGVLDIEKKRINCVGEPSIRLQEDALRILRGLRFQSTLSFEIEVRTFDAMEGYAQLLKKISPERISRELDKLLCGENVRKTLVEGAQIIGTVIPEILPTIGFEQQNFHHCYNILMHTAVSVEMVKPVDYLRWTMLFHDLGKPGTFSVDDSGVGHFYGHAKESEKIAWNRLNQLRLPKEKIKKICQLIKYHDAVIEKDEKLLKRWLNRLGEVCFRDLLEIKRADCRAQAKGVHYRLKDLDEIEGMIDRIINGDACFSLKDLAVNGNDLKALGIENGPEIGRILKRLLKAVMDEEIENTKEILLKNVEKGADDVN